MRKIVHFHDWLYYRCYCWSKKKGAGGDPWVHAGLTFDYVLLLSALVLSVLLLFLFPALRGVLHIPSAGIAVAGALGIVGLHLSFLQHKDRYKAIISKFENESAEMDARGMRIFNWYWFALLLSLLALALYAWLKSLQEGRGAG